MSNFAKPKVPAGAGGEEEEDKATMVLEDGDKESGNVKKVTKCGGRSSLFLMAKVKKSIYR